MKKRNLWVLMKSGTNMVIVSGYNVASLVRTVRESYRRGVTRVIKETNKEYRLETKQHGRIIAIHYLKMMK